jgi:hypothetical protein
MSYFGVVMLFFLVVEATSLVLASSRGHAWDGFSESAYLNMGAHSSTMMLLSLFMIALVVLLIRSREDAFIFFFCRLRWNVLKIVVLCLLQL